MAPVVYAKLYMPSHAASIGFDTILSDGGWVYRLIV